MTFLQRLVRNDRGAIQTPVGMASETEKGQCEGQKGAGLAYLRNSIEAGKHWRRMGGMRLETYVVQFRIDFEGRVRVSQYI